MGTTSRVASLTAVSLRGTWNTLSYHARAGKGIPAESDAIPILDVAPLIFERLVLHSVVGSDCF